MTGLLIAVPWRPSDSDDRERAMEYVLERLLALEVDGLVGVVTVDDDPFAPFSRGRSANCAFQAAKGMGADTVIINDADMILPTETYGALWLEAVDSGRVVVGFNDYRALDKQQSAQVYAGADPFSILRPAHRLRDFSVGGVGAMTVEAWEAVGGYDPRFDLWNPDDWNIWHAANVILGPGIRMAGPAVHLFHPSEKDRSPAARKAGAELHARYVACTTPDEIRAIRSEVGW